MASLDMSISLQNSEAMDSIEDGPTFPQGIEYKLKMVNINGVDIAAFNVEGEDLLCFPQVYEYFLKDMVSGMHTVYTKLKRMNIQGKNCNVEQVRMMRSVGAIGQVVNRCKLITRDDFNRLYEDCLLYRGPGRRKKIPDIPPGTITVESHGPYRGFLKQEARNGLPTMAMSSPTDRTPSTHSASSLSPDNMDTTEHHASFHSDLLSHHEITNIPSPNDSDDSTPSSRTLSPQYTSISIMNLPKVTSPRMTQPPPVSPQASLHRPLTSNIIPPSSTPISPITLSSSSVLSHPFPPSGSVNSAPIPPVPQLLSTPHSSNSRAVQSNNTIASRGYVHPMSMPVKSSPANERRNIDGVLIDSGSVAKVTNAGNTSMRGYMKPDHYARIRADAVEKSSTETLLTNIQGLLKVAAENSRMHERRAAMEIAELRNQLKQEKEAREKQDSHLAAFMRSKEEQKSRAMLEEQLKQKSPDTLRQINESLAVELDREKMARVDAERKLKEARGGIQNFVQHFLPENASVLEHQQQHQQQQHESKSSECIVKTEGIIEQE